MSGDFRYLVFRCVGYANLPADVEADGFGECPPDVVMQLVDGFIPAGSHHVSDEHSAWFLGPLRGAENLNGYVGISRADAQAIISGGYICIGMVDSLRGGPR